MPSSGEGKLPDHIGGERPESRVCSRWVGGTFAGPDEIICGKQAVAHVLWVLTEAGYEHGFVCADHRGEIPGKYPALAVHLLGHACDMPGSRCHPDGCTSDDLPVAEPNRTLAVAVSTPARSREGGST